MRAVYALVCPETHRVRYIGSTSNLQERLYGHKVRVAKGGCSKALQEWIVGLATRGLSFCCVVLEEVASGDLREAETAWYLRYRDSGLLLNALELKPNGVVDIQELRTLKKKYGLTYKQLADAVGLRSWSGICLYFNGNTNSINLTSLKRIEEYLRSL